MTGRQIHIPKGYRVKDGKLVKCSAHKDVSSRARERGSKRIKIVRGTR